MACPFCNIPCLSQRIFYKNDKWLALLSAPRHTRGHAILARLSSSQDCPTGFDAVTLSGLGDALSDVTQVIKQQYDPKDVLIASVRGDVKHFHIHLIPLHKDEEDAWRRVTGYKDSHLLEFLGSLEKRRDFQVLELEAKGKSEEQQRSVAEKELETEIQELRKKTGYTS